jgi:hypothetical protein
VFSLPPKSIKIEGIGRKNLFLMFLSNFRRILSVHFTAQYVIIISVHFTAQYQTIKQKNELSAKMHVQ